MSMFNLNTGYYYGSGASSIGGYSGTNASSINFTRVSRDMGSGYAEKSDAINNFTTLGNLDNALLKYQELLDYVKESASSYGYEFSDSQIATIAKNAYNSQTQATKRAYGAESVVSLTESISKNTHSPFVTGLIEGIPIIGTLFGESYSNAEAINKMDGTKTRVIDEISEGAGAAISGAAILGGACLVLEAAEIGSIGGPVGAIAGAALGIGAVVIKGLINKQI